MWTKRLFLCFLALLLFSFAAASPPVSRKEALSAAFPGAAIHSQRIFLTEKQRERAAALAGVDIPSSLIARYLALEEGREIGRAYVDTHIVRTKKETLLICLDADGNVKRIEVTAFLEPPEYMASRAWYGQYQGKALDAELNLHRVIRPIAGATLTAMATNEAVRRVLAIDRVLRAAGGAP